MTVTKEIISKIGILQSGDLILVLASGGQEVYQYIYRAAKGVYWDKAHRGFRFAIRDSWSNAVRFQHIADVCQSECGIEFELSDVVEWDGLSSDDVSEIRSSITAE